MNVEFDELDTNWVDADTTYSLVSDSDYLIQNRGPDFCLAYVSSTAPAEGDVDGVLIPNLMQVHYKKGTGTLYLRAYNKNCSVNISEAAE